MACLHCCWSAVWSVPEVSSSLRVGAVSLWLGDASYSIYLTHTFVISALGKIWPPSLAAWAFIAVATVCAALVGGLVYRFVERPLLTIMRGPRRPRIASKSGESVRAA